ncbi:ATP-binding protein [candidate division KSB1 bacterium]|nr:ATP-binding protein [candidate division KSB1 bacterium]
MKYSIRTRLTVLITLVFLCLFLFILIAGAIALYLGLNEEIDRAVKIEEKRVTEIFELEYLDLLLEKIESRKSLRDEFVAELNEMYQYKHQFVIFSLESNTAHRIYAGGELKNVQLLLPSGFLSKKSGAYNQRFEGELYRVLITQKDWGTLILGAKNQTFFEVADEFKEIFLVGIPVILILVFWGAHFLARRAMRPVVSTAKAADTISLTNLGGRLSEYNQNDEFGILVKTLNNMIARLEAGIKRIQQFTQDAAHELRTPLTLLRGELELLYQKDDISADIRSILQKTLDRTISLNKIVNDLMLLAQSDSGGYPLDKRIFQLDQVMTETVEDVKVLSENQPIEVTLSHCDRVEFFGDEQLIRRVLLNLADNALKYTNRGQIDFSLESRNDTIEIKISDTGTGIPDEDLPHIFDRFYRVDKARTGSKGGSGLGLSISKWIVTAHAGEIHIESARPGGTIVTISFSRNKFSS